jgi:solute carrier family 25 citrate transporter 1
MSSKEQNKKKNPLQHLIAGGCAGFVESSVCHPLDTIKTRMQLRRQTQTLEAVKARSSLTEPALRLKHSLQEPALRLKHSLQEPLGVIGRGGDATLHKAHVHEPSLKMSMSAHTPPPPPTHPVKGTVTASLGPIGTARRIIQREGFMSLYKGLTAVWTGIVPKMAIRFLSFEEYKQVLSHTPMGTTSYAVFLAGLASGLTEAVMVVTPAEVCKIRMQSQYHSMIDPSQVQHRKYTNVLQTAFTIVKEEGLSALYKGVVPTMMRQGCNQAVNFTAYGFIKRKVMEHQGTSELQHWQSLLIGGMSGGMGPMVNNPLDVVKTRMQKQVVVPGKTPKYTGLFQSCAVIAREEGYLALWKGITPRLMRIMPGQAITFMTYEAISSRLHRFGVL